MDTTFWLPCWTAPIPLNPAAPNCSFTSSHCCALCICYCYVPLRYLSVYYFSTPSHLDLFLLRQCLDLSFSTIPRFFLSAEACQVSNGREDKRVKSEALINLSYPTHYKASAPSLSIPQVPKPSIFLRVYLLNCLSLWCQPLSPSTSPKFSYFVFHLRLLSSSFSTPANSIFFPQRRTNSVFSFYYFFLVKYYRLFCWILILCFTVLVNI